MKEKMLRIFKLLDRIRPKSIEKDKFEHFFVSMICSAAEGVVGFYGSHTFLASFAWELSDWKHGKFDWKDIFANTIGIITGQLIILAIKLA